MRFLVNRGGAKGKMSTLKTPRFVIGRAPECQLRPNRDEVSARHAEFKVISGMILLNDLGSENGTVVNGETLNGPASLRNGDRIEIGPLSFTLLIAEPNRGLGPLSACPACRSRRG